MCEKCLYKANCQFLARHNKAIIEDCTAFKNETDLYRDVVEKLFDEFYEIMSDNFHMDCQIGDCIEDYYDEALYDDFWKLKKKYQVAE